MMRQYINPLVLIGILFLFACAGTKIDGKLITPQNLNDITGIEWDLTQRRMAFDEGAIYLTIDLFLPAPPGQ